MAYNHSRVAVIQGKPGIQGKVRDLKKNLAKLREFLEAALLLTVNNNKHF